MRGSTFLLRPRASTIGILGKSPFLFLSSLSLSLYPILSPSPVCFLSFLPFFSLIPPNFTLMFVPISFSHFSFSLFFLFLLSIPSFSHFSSLIWIASTRWSKSGGNFPPLSSITLVITMFFFLISFFPFIT